MKDGKTKGDSKKYIKDLPSYYEDFSVEDLEIIKEQNPTQYALIMARLKIKALETIQSKTPQKKNLMDSDDF
jgi:hypothetical protein